MHEIYSFLLLICLRLVHATIGDKCHSNQGVCQLKNTCKYGYTTLGDCPKDPGNVLCCISGQSCGPDNFSGTCRNKTAPGSCDGYKGFFPGCCPGNNEVQCCIDKDESDGFADYLKRVYGLAVQWGSKDPNRHVMEWLRHEKYNGLISGWKLLIGNVDDDWIQFAKDNGLSYMFKEFSDPAYCREKIGTAHWGASMNAVYLKPPQSSPHINHGDFGGWGGDLTTFYGEWVGSHLPPCKDGYEFLVGALATPGSKTFKLQDFLEDVDAYNIGQSLLARPSTAIYEEVSRYYSPNGGYKRRFESFYESRFGGTEAEAKRITWNMMTEGELNILDSLRIAAITTTAKDLVHHPRSLGDDLQGFIDGFAYVLTDFAKDVGLSCEA